MTASNNIYSTFKPIIALFKLILSISTKFLGFSASLTITKGTKPI